RARLRYAKECGLTELWVIGGEVVAADDAPLAQRRIELLNGQRAADGELVEVWAAEERREARKGADALLGVVGAAQALFTQVAEADLAKRGELDGSGQRQQSLVCADIRGGALTADVLLARLKGQDVAGLAAVVHRLADETAWQPADEGSPGREK